MICNNNSQSNKKILKPPSCGSFGSSFDKRATLTEMIKIGDASFFVCPYAQAANFIDCTAITVMLMMRKVLGRSMRQYAVWLFFA
ncbi:MAG: hypothetical protein CSB24_03325 [Deltaproteobacteria bacterium]|nr:MAG: hypothetical protein CSB24_03325 [Deltaproteobacteria bacterium]